MTAARASKIGARGSANVRRGWDGERRCVFTFLSDIAWEVLDVGELKNAGTYGGNGEPPDTEPILGCFQFDFDICTVAESFSSSLHRLALSKFE